MFIIIYAHIQSPNDCTDIVRHRTEIDCYPLGSCNGEDGELEQTTA